MTPHADDLLIKINLPYAVPEEGISASATILQSIAEADKDARVDCIKAYGNLVWALAKNFTANREDAEDAALEIFTDIWKYAGQCDAGKSAEADFIILIARRCLVRRALIGKKSGRE